MRRTNMLLGDILIQNCDVFPHKTGFIDGQNQNRYTWIEVNKRVNALGNSIIEMGCKKGDRVAIISENSLECAEFHFATAKVGVIACPLNYRLHPKQLRAIIRDAGPRMVFFQSQYYELVENISGDVGSISHYVSIGEEKASPIDYESLINIGSHDEPVAEVNETDPVIITYSSGTTGLPKGIVSTHKNRIAYGLESCLFAERFTHDDVVLVSAPFCAGVSGQIQLTAPAMVGASVVMYVLKGDTWGEVIEREKVTALITTKSRMMPVYEFSKNSKRKYNLSTLRKVTTGGQTHSEEDLRELLGFCGVSYTAKMYGLSETAATGCRLLPDEIRACLQEGATEAEKRKLDSVGKPVMSMKLRLIDKDGREVNRGEIGEIVLKGDSVSSGYWKNKDLTERTFRDGWLFTGDMGLQDEDGYVYLRGRKDFMIKSGGFMISPIEIERVLMNHPAVHEAAVIGLPDEKWGEAVVAIIGLKENRVIDENALKQFCRENLARFQVPKTFRFISSLPRDEAGRIQVGELKRKYLSESVLVSTKSRAKGVVLPSED
jgi:acyl-CoA synthetase (AMP-forming)/AMP-acid ligase II